MKMAGVSISRFILTCIFALTGLLTTLAGFFMLFPAENPCGPASACNYIPFRFGLVLIPLGCILAVGALAYYRNVSGIVNTNDSRG